VSEPRARPSTRPGRDHYSYSIYADPITARTFDDRRFGGPIGELVSSAQARALMDFAGPVDGKAVLDVGTGTGRAALLFARAGALVTAVDASDQMLAVARARAANQGASVTFLLGDAHRLDFNDRAFDVVVSLRVLMHSPDWRRCLAELCRVSAQRVVFDYPSARSAAALEAVMRRVIHGLGAETEPYSVFTDTTIARELERLGFRVRSVHRQFVLPIAMHKAIGSSRFTHVSEHLLGRIGLLRLFGSPVTMFAERCVSS
jgi:ubiquinone/menaquinone biosynthesis C-methylase UbiE